jgi:uncharacterized membrane protein YdbT with pleckstrin-like domain
MTTLRAMPYPRKLLNTGEQIALDLHPHWMFFAEPALALLGSLLLTIVLLIGTSGDWPLVGVVVLLVSAGWFGIRYLKWSTTHFVVTTGRVIYRHGVFAKAGVEIPLERIMNVNFNQSFWERIVAAGDLVIESGGKDGQSRFTDVRKPEMVQNMIHAQMHASEDARTGRVVQAAAPMPPPAADVPSQLDKLDDLRKRGVITDAEFNAQKAKLLDKM